MSRLYPKLRFLLIPIVIALLCFSLGKWFSISHQSWSQGTDNATIASNAFLHGSYHEVSIPPEKADQYLSADYRLWVPDSMEKIRGLIVKQHGCGDAAAATGLDHANDLQWQALAAKHSFALLGTKLPTSDKPCEYWALINYGSGNAFLKALHALAKKSQRPELEKIPWVLWGHSGGADWAAQMLQEHPERTIAMVGMRCGGFTFLGTNPSLAGIPVLFALGEKEPTVGECLELPQRVFSRYRKINAAWTLAVERSTGHESGNTRFLAIPYLDAMTTARLASPGNPLRSVIPTQGWLGSLSTHKIAPMDRYEENSLEAAWLPNEEVANKWREYVTVGKITPGHKLTVPTDVRATKNNLAEAVITWNFAPDLENGLPSFRVYRGKSLIATLKGQDHKFGDSPEPANVVLKFVDKAARFDSTYTVAAFNASGESASESTPLKGK